MYQPRPLESGAPPSDALDKRRVLIVDDDALSAKLAAILLRAEGYHVECVRSAEDALVQIERARPDLVLVDLILPLMSGLLLAQQLKSKPETADLILIAVTVFNGNDAARLAREAGCAAYLRKPFESEEFIALVRGYIGEKP